MKKYIYILVIILYTTSIFAQKNFDIHFYMNDGSEKKITINDIENISFMKKLTGNYLCIYYKDTLYFNIQTSIIDSTVFDLLNTVKTICIYSKGVKNSFNLSEIDSITCFYSNLKITSISPNQSVINTLLTINGMGFGAKQGNSYVSFKGMQTKDYSIWTDNQIIVTIPKSAESGDVTVTVNNITSNASFLYITPKINTISPVSAKAGDTLTVTGVSFGKQQDTSYALINGTTKVSEYFLWNDSLIKLRIPASIIPGYISITVKGKKSNDNTTFVSSSPSIKIGGQTWMTENLNVDHYRNGDPIPEVTSISEWDKLTTGAWCYYKNDDKNGTVYSKIYNWFAIHDSRGLAPAGWHIPTGLEWSTLSTFLGGDDISGGKMKETGTNHWTTPNFGATNLSGFTGLPGGYRSNIGAFNGLNDYGYWWSSTEDDELNAIFIYLNFSTTNLIQTTSLKLSGYYVRCMK